MTAAIDYPSMVLVSPRIERRLSGGFPPVLPRLKAAPRRAGRSALAIPRAVLVLVAASLAAVLVTSVACVAAGRPAEPGRQPVPSRADVGRQLTVHTGDTLWSLAHRVAPDRDPRAEVDDLIRLNGLTDSRIAPGQLLGVR